jgi:hypothetical protein
MNHPSSPGVAWAQAEVREAVRSVDAEKLPLAAVLRQHRRDVLVAMGARMAQNIGYYVVTAFILAHATTSAGAFEQRALTQCWSRRPRASRSSRPGGLLRRDRASSRGWLHILRLRSRNH